MKISSITAYAQHQPFRDGTYTCSGGRSAEGFDSTIVAIGTDSGITGWGEMAPLGSFYAPAFAAGARAGIAELAPYLLGQDPRQLRAIERLMDHRMAGHPYVKAALDMACWDVAARAAGQPLAEFLGGRFGPSVALYRSISQEKPDRMVARARKYVTEGYRRLQVKVGLDPREDIERLLAVRAAIGADIVLFADANGSWTTAEARQFLLAVRDVDFTLEQPCGSYEDCISLRSVCAQPLVLDENIDSLDALLRAKRDGVDGVTIKIARVGGIGRARAMRDVAVDLNLKVTVEDTGGSDIDTAAMAHLSLSTPQSHRLHTVDFHNWVTVSNARGMPPCLDGEMSTPTGPGLGLEIDVASLGKPFLEIRA
nr:mandelate racemase/muconate lactonizing enzyme family protein [uncultured Dongia sp.]